MVDRPSELPGVQRKGPAAAWNVIRQRNFGPYFIGNAASATGTWFQYLAASVLVYQQTQSAFLLGVLTCCQFAPVLLLAPWTGGIADRVDRRHLLLVTQSLAAVVTGVIAVLSWNGLATAWVVIGLSAVIGVLAATSGPAQMAMVGSLVKRSDLPQAVALNAMTFNLARAVGPLAATGVMAALGTAAAFAVNSGSFVIFVLALLFIHPRETERTHSASFAETIALVRRDPSLYGYLLVVAVVSFSTDPVNTEAPAFAAAFGFSALWAGAIVGAFGAGAVLGALFLAGRVAGTAGRMALTLGLCGGGILLFSLTPLFGLALVFLTVAGFGYLGSNAAATSQLQLRVTEQERGRIMALWSICFFGIRPIASIVDGALASTFGVHVAGVVMSIPALLAAMLVAKRAYARGHRREPTSSNLPPESEGERWR